MDVDLNSMQIQHYLPLIVIVYFIAISTLLIKTSRQAIDNQPGRDAYIDGLRGIAAIAVVATHFWRLGESGISYSFEFSNREAYGSLGVQIFFCITGLLFFSKIYGDSRSIDWTKFYAARFRRLIPAYTVFFFLSLAVLLIVGNWSDFKSSQLYNIGNMAYMGFKGNGRGVFALGIELDRVFAAIWTLAFEVRFYLVFPFIVWVSTTKVGDKFLLPLGAALVWYEIASTGSCIAGYFLVGAVAAKHLRKVKCSPALLIACYAVIAITLYLSITMKLNPFGWERFALSSAMFISLAVSKPALLATRPMTALGDMSYSLYLLHAPLLLLVSHMVKVVVGPGAPSTAQYMLVVMAGVVVMFVVSLYSYRFVELPFLRKNTASSQSRGAESIPRGQEA